MLHLEGTFCNHLLQPSHFIYEEITPLITERFLLRFTQLLSALEPVHNPLPFTLLMPTWERKLCQCSKLRDEGNTIITALFTVLHHTFITCHTFCFICGVLVAKKIGKQGNVQNENANERRELRPLLLQLPQQHVCCFLKGYFGQTRHYFQLRTWRKWS